MCVGKGKFDGILMLDGLSPPWSGANDDDLKLVICDHRHKRDGQFRIQYRCTQQVFIFEIPGG